MTQYSSSGCASYLYEATVDSGDRHWSSRELVVGTMSISDVRSNHAW
jgi:hypothetical protein